MMKQEILSADNNYAELSAFIKNHKCKRILLVCDNSFEFLNIKDYFSDFSHNMNVELYRFSDFQPNPTYESVEKGVCFFVDNHCDTIIAVGGGSAMDVAKCIKLYSNMDHTKNYLKQSIVPNDVLFIAEPTTAGTGSEATRYAVIYYNGEKQSVSHISCIPSAVVFDPSALKTLPLYQKKSTMLDALCHAIESYWSVNSDDESKHYSKEAIQIILTNLSLYLENDDKGCAEMLRAANIAGKAINITQTTAGHAMCYKLTSLYGISHGHAAALCVSKLFPYMIEHSEKCVDKRGKVYFENICKEIAVSMGCTAAKEGAAELQNIIDSLNPEIPAANENDFEILKKSVNTVRLKNNPVELNSDDIDMLYHQILQKR